jgi:hypothetical protein
VDAPTLRCMSATSLSPIIAPPGPDLDLVVRVAAWATSFPTARPWLARPIDSGVELWARGAGRMSARARGAREARLSVGAALFAMRLALAVQGYRPVVTLLPEPTRRPDLLAVLRPGDAAAPTPVERSLYTVLDPDRVAAWSHEGRGEAGVRILLRHAATAERTWLHIMRGTDALVRLANPVPAQRWSLTRFPGSLQLLIATYHDLPIAHLWAGQALQRVVLTASLLGLDASILVAPCDQQAVAKDLDFPSGLTPQALLLVRPPAPGVFQRLAGQSATRCAGRPT